MVKRGDKGNMENTISPAGAVAQKSKGEQRNNNFNIIRMIATIFVFAGHMGIILGGSPTLFGSWGMHQIGVNILFTISGYLITMSWLSDPSPVRYGIRRFFRLWPPFAVMILLMVYVAGPLLSNLGVKGYFESSYGFYLHNLRFFIVYDLPGVFTELPCANTINGSLWTMPVEAAIYVLTPLILTALRVKGHSKASFHRMLVFAAIVCGFDAYIRIALEGEQIVFYGVDMIYAYHLLVFYVIGMLFTYEEVRKYLNLQIGLIGLCVLLFFQFSSSVLQYLVMYAALPYFIFSFAFAPDAVFHKAGRKAEISYGIYLYGFFFQQLVIDFGLKYPFLLHYTPALLVSGFFTVIAALLSHFLVEEPSLRLSRFLVRKLKEGEKRRKQN